MAALTPAEAALLAFALLAAPIVVVTLVAERIAVARMRRRWGRR